MDRLSSSIEHLPDTVRYIKNGPGGRWWPAAKGKGQLHCGWREVPKGTLEAGDLAAAKEIIERYFEQHGGAKGVATRDFEALKHLLVHPSQHIWMTFAERRLWWCTVKDGVEAEPDGSPEASDHGHFWLTCERPWSDRALDGRVLDISDIPGTITATAGFRATVCKPNYPEAVLRLIRGEVDPAVATTRAARQAFTETVSTLVGALHDKDFELLVDLILARAGWARIARLGGNGADIDVEVQNQAANEIAFVQVKSRADQATLDDYVARFQDQRERYARMIFAYHRQHGPLTAPEGQPIQLWNGRKLAELVVSLGLSDWLEKRF